MKLTPRELDLVKGVVAGKSNKEIGSDLHLAEGTIKEYMNKLFRKLNLNTRTKVAVWGVKTLGLLLLVVITLFGQSLPGQTSHSATLTWTDTANPVGTTYSVYRATGLCSGTPTFSKLATAVASKTYLDSTVSPGNYCYQVTATFSGVESAPSNSAAAAVPSFAPTTLAVTVQ